MMTVSNIKMAARLSDIQHVLVSRMWASQFTSKPSVSDSVIGVGSFWSINGAFRPLRRDWTRLKDRRMSWILTIKKNDFESGFPETERS